MTVLFLFLLALISCTLIAQNCNMLTYPFTKCLNPQRVVNPYTGETIVVPCGKCSACGMNKSARYAFQCDCEALTSKYVVFVTLTYANTYVPRMRAFDISLTSNGLSHSFKMFDVTTPRNKHDNCLSYLGDVHYSIDLYNKMLKKMRLFGDIPYLRKRDLQLFLKTFRSYLPEYEIRYFASGEYGPDTFRPHFHLLFYINDPELVEATSVCKMSDFPEWTWPKKKSRVYRPEDKLSILEYYIRKTWQYGIVDCELVTEGSASSYVSSYVNGSQPLPPFLEMATSKCFSVHSRFLGRKVFRKELASVLSAPVDEFIKGSLEIGSKSREYTLSYSNYSYYYPKCQGFSTSDSRRRLELYKSYDTVKSLFGDKKLIDLARDVADVFYMYCLLRSDYNKDFYNITFYTTYTDDIIHLADLLYPFSNVGSYGFEPYYVRKAALSAHYGMPSKADMDKIVYTIYSRLLVSRTFCENYRLLGVSPEWYLFRIEEFYSRLDYLHLTEWFESQSAYFDEDFSDEDDIVYFYNNTDYDFDNFKNSFSYRAYHCNVKTLSKQFMKHKLQNDKNRIFVNDDDD